MAKRVNVKRNRFLPNVGAVVWHVTSQDGYVDAEFTAWDGRSTVDICDDEKTVEQVITELTLYLKAVKRARAEVASDKD